MRAALVFFSIFLFLSCSIPENNDLWQHSEFENPLIGTWKSVDEDCTVVISEDEIEVQADTLWSNEIFPFPGTGDIETINETTMDIILNETIRRGKLNSFLVVDETGNIVDIRTDLTTQISLSDASYTVERKNLLRDYLREKTDLDDAQAAEIGELRVEAAASGISSDSQMIKVLERDIINKYDDKREVLLYETIFDISSIELTSIPVEAEITIEYKKVSSSEIVLNNMTFTGNQ